MPALLTALDDACHRIGFFYLKNHNIPTHLTQHTLKLTHDFFAMPQNEKDNIAISLSSHFRGYGRLEGEITNGIPDYKETYDLGLERTAFNQPLNKPYQTLIGPNQWPSALANFKETILEYIDHMQQLGYFLMQAISSLLDDATSHLVHQFHPAASEAHAMLRLLHYPPGKQNQLGVGPHIDTGCLILLLQDEIGGLQVQNSEGKWIDVPPLPDTLVVNIGEMLQIWSKNRFKATTHRVINTSGKRRLSAPFFFEPNLSTIVPINSTSPISYGQRMLEVFKRSFEI